MSEAAPTEHPVEPEKKKRLFRRIPTSLLVTTLGIALTAWLLPAFTHQWDDRQKERELKAAIVADMAASTSRALVGGEAIWVTPPRKANRAELADDWARSSLAIEARLRAYFPGRTVTAWQIYTWMIDRWVAGHRLQADAELYSASATLSSYHADDDLWEDPQPRALANDAGVWAAAVLDEQFKGPGPDFRSDDFYGDGILRELALYSPHRDYDGFPAGGRRSNVGDLRAGVGQLEVLLLTFEQELTSEVLDAHAKGYSTTARDLFHDLLPF